MTGSCETDLTCAFENNFSVLVSVELQVGYLLAVFGRVGFMAAKPLRERDCKSAPKQGFNGYKR
jgi:hypothetical protein